jgi:undecaprenyl diphosphate synthase
MDGNGRWAQQRRLPRIEGHKEGITSVQSAVETCRRLGIPFLTLYTFSVENWQRPKAEVAELMKLLHHYLNEEIPLLHRNAVRLRAIGQIGRLPAPVRMQLRRIMKKTAGHDKLTLVLALSYGGRREILDAVEAEAAMRREGRGGPLTQQRLASLLYAPDIPDPDLLIRTSGEMRLSNFLTWQTADTRLHFAPEFWPDFREEQLLRVIAEERLKAGFAAGAPS